MNCLCRPPTQLTTNPSSGLVVVDFSCHLSRKGKRWICCCTACQGYLTPRGGKLAWQIGSYTVSRPAFPTARQSINPFIDPNRKLVLEQWHISDLWNEVVLSGWKQRIQMGMMYVMDASLQHVVDLLGEFDHSLRRVLTFSFSTRKVRILESKTEERQRVVMGLCGRVASITSYVKL